MLFRSRKRFVFDPSQTNLEHVTGVLKKIVEVSALKKIPSILVLQPLVETKMHRTVLEQKNPVLSALLIPEFLKSLL